jgi:hypothetical protein
MNKNHLKYLRITPRELRLAKIDRKPRIHVCSQEFEAFLSALENFGDGKVPFQITKKLADCMDQKVCSKKSIFLSFIILSMSPLYSRLFQKAHH